MPQIEAASEELEPTFLRLIKIYWSQFWRAILILFPLFVLIFALGAYMGMKDPGSSLVFPQIRDIFTNKFAFFFYATSLIMLYFLQCLLFRLIIGNSYSDFTLSFVPKKDWSTPGFWPALFHVSWAYFWRTSIIMIILKLAELFLPIVFESVVINGLVFVLELLLYTLLLRFVVNQQYGFVRLSLLNPDVKDS